ncbi:site-specific integrase [Collimonas sp.]|jgi:hypothetical protein|uniref:site-specific integrase n=1 Tax=Collimonas sp. TaxID=1963772 RepID=UPI002BC1D736|nr:site-specific integrase [Collimonas sp.]HWW04173.1 site-specific integrase [Collimonas sp.]
MPELQLPDLTFPTVKFGRRETRWDLRPLLYRGGASAPIKQVITLLEREHYGPPIMERLELVKKLHEEINGNLVGGGSRHTAYTFIRGIRRLFAWADEGGHALNMHKIADSFKCWSDHLLQLQRVAGNMTGESLYSLTTKIARLLDAVLQRRIGLMRETRIRAPRGGKAARSIQKDKQDLEETFRFGHLLLDVCNSLSLESIRGPLPIKISLRTGEILEEWSALIPIENLKQEQSLYRASVVRERRAAWEADTSLRTRHPVINLRIEAELQIFVSQTGMNFAQAHSARNGRFHYTSHLDGYQVRRYKDRRGGEVEFDIYGEYKVFFERYLVWRNIMFPKDPDGLLFPIVRMRGGLGEKAPPLNQLKTLCKKLAIRFIGPRELRNTRVNWLLRRSQDVEMTAEMAQHTQETLLRTYAKPNLQVAMVEIARFHNRSDPTISPPGPGSCITPTPRAMVDMPEDATPPDCVSAAGCLFCDHQRDIDTEDHVWSLASFRHLKSIELANYRPPALGEAKAPDQFAAAAIDRLTSKLKFFKISNEVRGLWVHEALARVAEGDYHPAWDGFILLGELQS